MTVRSDVTAWWTRARDTVEQWLDRPIPPDDLAKIDAWVNERRERDADLTFHVERDITDHRPTQDHVKTPAHGVRYRKHARPRGLPVGNVEDQAAALFGPDKPTPYTEEPT